MPDDDNHDTTERWRSFVSTLPSTWLSVATAFEESSGILRGEHEPDGSWIIDVTFSLGDVRRLLRSAPVAFHGVAAHQNWWLDAHLEDEGGIAVANEARAVVVWNDNFASGLDATLHVFASQERFEAKVAELRTEASDDDDDGGADADADADVDVERSP